MKKILLLSFCLHILCWQSVLCQKITLGSLKDNSTLPYNEKRCYLGFERGISRDNLKNRLFWEEAICVINFRMKIEKENIRFNTNEQDKSYILSHSRIVADYVNEEYYRIGVVGGEKMDGIVYANINPPGKRKFLAFTTDRGITCIYAEMVSGNNVCYIGPGREPKY